MSNVLQLFCTSILVYLLFYVLTSTCDLPLTYINTNTNSLDKKPSPSCNKTMSLSTHKRVTL